MRVYETMVLSLSLVALWGLIKDRVLETLFNAVDYLLFTTKQCDYHAASTVIYYLIHNGCLRSSSPRYSASIPIHVFDIPSMTNLDLRRAWDQATKASPAIVLLEDFDNVFHGRENIAPGSLVTFDCLLNCLDGVEKKDGILVFVTTNHPDKLDSALIGRRGRIDKVVEFSGLDDQGKRQIAMRILGQELNIEGADTPSDYQERCIQEALSKRFHPHS